MLWVLLSTWNYYIYWWRACKFISIIYSVGFKYLFYLAIPLIIGTLFTADKIVLLLYGDEYRNAINALRILIFASAFNLYFLYFSLIVWYLFVMQNDIISLTNWYQSFCCRFQFNYEDDDEVRDWEVQLECQLWYVAKKDACNVGSTRGFKSIEGKGLDARINE